VDSRPERTGGSYEGLCREDGTIHDAKTNIESFAGRTMDRIRGAANVLKEMGYDGELTEVNQPLELEE